MTDFREHYTTIEMDQMGVRETPHSNKNVTSDDECGYSEGVIRYINLDPIYFWNLNPTQNQKDGYWVPVPPPPVDGGGNLGWLNPPAYAEPVREATSRTAPVGDPIILDLDGDGIETTSVFNGTSFDYSKDGFAESTAWVRPGEGILATDTNDDGVINDGTELVTSLSTYDSI